MTKQPLPDGYLSVRQYAKEKGVDHKAVSNAIKTGKIKKGTGYVTHTDGRRYIVRTIADKEWAENYQYTGNGSPMLLQTLPISNAGVVEDEDDGDTGGDDDAYKDALKKARTTKSILDAKLTQLEYETKSGAVVSKAQAERQLFEMGKRIRESILRVPDREIDTILAAGTRNQARELLYDALEAALLELSDIERQKVS
ncbi:MAG: hypothetical protein ACKO0Z_26270 [Betaproteobacteria bacterium]